MGTYQYTLRADSREIDGHTVARYGYAYKHSLSLGRLPGSRRGKLGAIESRADDAAWKHRNVRRFIEADSFAIAAKDGYPVFEIDREPPPSVAESVPGARIIGKLLKVRGRFVIIPWEV